jgi:hypothetical protein
MPIEVDGLVFLLTTNPPRLIPCKVVEQLVSRKSTGTSTTHIISTPSEKTYTLENVKHPWFSSLEEAENYLIDQAKKLVEQTIEKAKQDSSQFFSDDKHIGVALQQNQSSEEIELPENETTVVLENGVKARVILPEVLK